VVLKNYITIGVASVLLLNGCASTNTSKAKVSLEKKYLPNEIKVEYPTKNNKEYKHLRRIDRSHTAGLAVAKTGLFIISVIGALNGGYVSTGAVQGFSKDELMGSEITDAKNMSKLTIPLEEMKQIVANNVAKNIKKNPRLASTKYEYPIAIAPKGNTWKLTYNSLSGDENNTYILDSNITIYRPKPFIIESKEGEKAFLTSNSINCEYVSRPIALEKWVADDYKLVADTKKVIIKECAEKLSKAYDKLVYLPKNKKIK
jgi:hypothetical protein